MPGSYTFRAATADDVGLLRRMLHLAIFVPPGGAQPPETIVDVPELARYWEDWGRAGDEGIVALSDSEPAGAVWVRRFRALRPGYGFLSEDIPELTIAVVPGHRGCGVGSALLDAICCLVKAPAVSLSCDPRNPALRLYVRKGFVSGGPDGVYRKELNPDA